MNSRSTPLPPLKARQAASLSNRGTAFSVQCSLVQRMRWCSLVLFPTAATPFLIVGNGLIGLVQFSLEDEIVWFSLEVGNGFDQTPPVTAKGNVQFSLEDEIVQFSLEDAPKGNRQCRECRYHKVLTWLLREPHTCKERRIVRQFAFRQMQFRVHGLGVRVQGLGVRGQGLGFGRRTTESETCEERQFE